MLSTTLTLTFKEADGTTDRVEVFDKKTEDANIAIYNNHDVVVEPSLPTAKITFKATEATASAQFYGTRRNLITIRHEALKASPQGDILQPIIEKIETSSPVVFTRDEKIVQLNRLKAVINSDHFKDHYLEMQC